MLIHFRLSKVIWIFEFRHILPDNIRSKLYFIKLYVVGKGYQFERISELFFNQLSINLAIDSFISKYFISFTHIIVGLEAK
jgi:hypothetical protein